MGNVSAVICSRNDSPHNNDRLLATLCNYVSLYDEVVYVDYKSAKEPLHRVLKPHLPVTGKLRCIIVPPDGGAFVEVVARNIGIRRATGEYIASTNQDVIAEYPPSIREDTMYTVARYNSPVINSLEELRKIKGTMSRQPDSVTPEGEPCWDPGDRWSLVVSCGDYQIAHKSVWHSIRGFEEEMILPCYADSNVMKKAAQESNIAKLEMDVFHLDHLNRRGQYTPNDKKKFVVNFGTTTNLETWGNSTQDYLEEII